MAYAPSCFFFFFFNDTATTEIYTLSLHDALPISRAGDGAGGQTVSAPDPALVAGAVRAPQRRRGDERVWRGTCLQRGIAKPSLGCRLRSAVGRAGAGGESRRRRLGRRSLLQWDHRPHRP